MPKHERPNPETDPFRPPAIPTEVCCLHCGQEYESYLMEWREEADAKTGEVRGFWCCPTEGCGGAGFGFDIFPTDPEYRDENGQPLWGSDDDADTDADTDAEGDDELDGELEEEVQDALDALAEDGIILDDEFFSEGADGVNGTNGGHGTTRSNESNPWPSNHFTEPPPIDEADLNEANPHDKDAPSSRDREDEDDLPW